MLSSMFLKFRTSKEEKFLIDLIFKLNKISEEHILELDLDKLVILASNHLLLPALYVNLRDLKLLDYFPNELKIYLKKIYSVNFERNKLLKQECHDLKEILSKNQIQHTLIKGGYLLYNNVYDDLGKEWLEISMFLLINTIYLK